MRTKLTSRLSLLFMAFALMLALPALAFADNVSNNLDASVDAVAETMPLNVGGANGTTKLYVQPTGGDSKPGCNLTGSTNMVASVTSSNPSVATVSPSSVTFGSCGDEPILTVTPVAAGSTTISLAQTSNTSGGTFDLAPAAFTVNVSAAAPANTAPQVTVEGVDEGASYNKGSVPAATCKVTDAEDGTKTFAATLSGVTGTYASDGIGSQTASCSYTDGGGLTASASETYGIVDPSAPVIGYTLDPATADGSNGWYKGDVSLTWDVSEPQSPNSLQKTNCVDQNITADQAATEYKCSATSAGGSATEQSVTIKRDGTAPVVTLGAATGTLGSNSWYTSAVSQTFNATDATSGLAGPASFTRTSSGEGSAVSINSGAVTDNAGNTNNGISATFKIDLSDPTNVKFVGGPAAEGSYYFGETPLAPTCTADDAISQVQKCEVTGYSTAVGTHTMTATATDNAGRTAIATRSYTVMPYNLYGFYQPIDMGGVLNTVKNGSTVPVKFELFKGTTELTSTSGISITAREVLCGTFTGASVDEIEYLSATGGTTLRYDSTGGQFIYNWTTPKKPNTCYNLTMTAADGSKLTAYFKLR